MPITVAPENYDEVERAYWKNICFNPPYYGADVSGSLFDSKCETWNVSKLHTILDIIKVSFITNMFDVLLKKLDNF